MSGFPVVALHWGKGGDMAVPRPEARSIRLPSGLAAETIERRGPIVSCAYA
jgi:hypothetical protein